MWGSGAGHLPQQLSLNLLCKHLFPPRFPLVAALLLLPLFLLSLLPQSLWGTVCYSQQLTAFLVSPSIIPVSKTKGPLQEPPSLESIRILEANNGRVLPSCTIRRKQKLRESKNLSPSRTGVSESFGTAEGKGAV